MVKQGPCHHCGVTSTPLWRNGPPEKPVLCNACGSRWRTKGTLVNYAPLHSRAEPDDFVEYKIPKVKFASIKNKETKLVKRKQRPDHFVVLGKAPNHDQSYPRILEDDTSNRSSSGSVISYSESCVWYGGTDGSELTGSSQSVVWDAQVPSRKRTCVSHPKTSSVEKLTKDLHSILHEQQSSYFYGYSEEDLLFDSEDPMVSVEIGHGSILMKHPSSIAREEESEASSCTEDIKTNTVHEVYSGSNPLPVRMDGNHVDIRNVGQDAVKNTVGQGTQQEQKKGDKSHELFQVLQNPNSPLRVIDLKDVVSFENFVNHFTYDEQLQLKKDLPSVDTIGFPKSLKSMFDSHHFMEDLSSFQKLVAEGILDLSSSEIDVNFKDVKLKQKMGGKETTVVSKMSHVKKPGDDQNQQAEPAMMRGSKNVVNTMVDSNCDEYCFSPRSLFCSPLDKSSLMVDYMQFEDDGYNQDLLLDIPSNGSFPQAELLYPTSSFGSASKH